MHAFPAGDVRNSRSRFASIVALARFIEDLVAEQAGRGLSQYIIVGAGLDSLAPRRTDLASRPKVFEIDRPGRQA
jgi:O-methyltransferase involved in polyketide biosynthesis